MDPGFPIQWSLGAMDVPAAWKVTMAYHDRVICTVDSGVDASHPDLAANILHLPDGTYGYNFVANNNTPVDDGGHGTNVAGIAAAVTGNGIGISGVSQAYILAVKVLDKNGVGTDDNLAKGIRWCADHGANIILLAVEEDSAHAVVAQAIRDAEARDILIVASSGNEGKVCATCVVYPAAYPGVLAVGASMPNGDVAPFSNGGAHLGLLAPGVNVAGLWPGDRYAMGSGTSQAAANAAGAAALVWSVDPHLSAQAVKTILESTAKPHGTGFDEAYGHGYLRLDAAFALLGRHADLSGDHAHGDLGTAP
jgi:subtilisin family serine protease